MESIALETGSEAFGSVSFWPASSQSKAPLVLWIAANDLTGCTGPELDADMILEGLRAEGMACAKLESSRSCPDREGIACIEAALSMLAKKPQVDEDQLCIVGAGRGGTLAFLTACTSMQVGALALIDANWIYAELSAERPVQPLEMALNLSAPTLILTSGDGSSEVLKLRAEELSQAERVLSQFARPFDSFQVGLTPGSVSETAEEPRQTALNDEIIEQLLGFLNREWSDPDGA